MVKDFWSKLSRPFLVLAPMYDVTDAAFRSMFVARPDVYFTEFVSADGLCSKGREHLSRELYLDKSEHPIVAQIFGVHPENIESAARYAVELGFDGLDINMGCPDRAVMKQGAGASLIKNPKLAREIIDAAINGTDSEIPVSVKTRLATGGKQKTKEWMFTLKDSGVSAVTIHGRTAPEMSRASARWDEIAEAGAILKDGEIVVLGNGDITDINDAREKCEKYKLDGAMIGRATMGNPWFFSGRTPTVLEKIDKAISHAEKFSKFYGEDSQIRKERGWAVKNFAVMKKHFKAYANGFPGALSLRKKLMETDSAKEVRAVIEKFKNENPDLFGSES